MARPGSRPLPELARAFEEAVELYRQGRLADAEKIAERLRKAVPDNFDVLHLLGLVKLRGGQPAAALGLFESALKLNPSSPQGHSSRGLALAALDRDAEALASFERALALAPADADALNNRGTVLLKLGRPAQALETIDRLAALRPDHLGARINRGNALAALERLDEALAQYDTLAAAHPGHADIHFNRGNVLSGLRRYDDAIAAFDRALALRRDYLKAHLNRGMALQAINRHAEALASFTDVLAIDKTHADAQHNMALSRLTLGEYGAGFALHEMRWRRSGMPARRRSFGKPLWLGEFPLHRKTILLHAEQGLGDTIQFARYAPLLARQGAKVVLEVPPELVGLLCRLECVSGVVARGEPLPDFDVHCPLASLPLACRTEVASIPVQIPYLQASPDRLAKWQTRLAQLPAPRIALAWSGSAAHPNDRNRSIALATLAPLLNARDARFIAVQRELRAPDAAVLADLPQLVSVGEALADFEDTAAVLALADLVISVDTSVVHLAGALGRPTWILLPFCPDWRWMLGRSDSPWYPTARLYRQPAVGDWDSVIAQVRQALAQAG